MRPWVMTSLVAIALALTAVGRAASEDTPARRYEELMTEASELRQKANQLRSEAGGERADALDARADALEKKARGAEEADWPPQGE